MVERVCPRCQHGNPLVNQYCGQCGTTLVRHLPAPADDQSHPLALVGRQLPVSLRQVGQGVAIGLAALAAEAGMAWLRGRVAQIGTAPLAPPTALRTTNSSPEASPLTDVTTVVSQRVLEIWENGALTRKVVEHAAWKKTRN